MAAAKKRRWSKVVTVVAVVCVLVLLGVYLYRRYVADYFWRGGPDLLPVHEISLFPYDYALHVSRDPGPVFVIERWYAPWSERPNLNQVRRSLRLTPSHDEWRRGQFPFRNAVIETNLDGRLASPCFDVEAGLYRRVSQPGANPAFVYTVDEEVWSHVLRHNPDLTSREATLTFELDGTDAESGATVRQRHHLRLSENPKAEGDVYEPAFLITSHTIEELPVGRTSSATNGVVERGRSDDR